MLKNFCYLNLIFVLSQPRVLAFQPATENNYMLVGHVYRTTYTPDWFSCIQACHDDPRCTLYNYERSAAANGFCELNDCGQQDLCDKEKSLLYSPGFVFQQIRECKEDEPNVYSADNQESNKSVPIDCPQNVREISKTSTSIFITWDAVEDNERNGKILSYEITYIRFTRQNDPHRRRVMVPIVYANLTGLHLNRRYNITVLASNVNGDGPSSDIVTIRTDQGKPRAPPANVTIFNKTSTSILITWDEVPDGKKKGRILQYKVGYTAENNEIESEVVDAPTRYLKIVNLKKNTNYTITVSASTVKGYGPASEPLSVITNQDVPSAPPQKVRATNKTANSILITWYAVPANQQNGQILTYNVTYTKRSITETKQVEAAKLYLNLSGLQANTNYSITVTASTIKGPGPASQAIYAITEQEGFLRRNLQIHQKHIKANAYKTLVRPQIEYASTVWDPFTQENQTKIKMVQRRAARFVCNNYSREASVTAMLNELAWRSLVQRRADSRLIMFYKIVNSLVEVDFSKELIPLTRYSRKTHTKSYRIPNEKKTYLQYSFLPRTIKQWNNLPAMLATAPNINSFKSGVCQLTH